MEEMGGAKKNKKSSKSNRDFGKRKLGTIAEKDRNRITNGNQPVGGTPLKRNGQRRKTFERETRAKGKPTLVFGGWGGGQRGDRKYPAWAKKKGI